MTAQQLQEVLQDVPQATLYRHLKKMTDAHVLTIVDEIPNRGTLEKLYMLPSKAAEISQEEFMQASADEHFSYFMNYIATLIGGYERYLNQDFDLVKDGVSYRQYDAYLSEEENLELLYAIRDLINKAMSNEPDPSRKKRLISVIHFPEI